MFLLCKYRDDEDWFENRKLMNSFLLRGDQSLAQRVTETCCRNLMDDWHRLATGGNDFVEIPNLIKTLYKWSIDVVTGVMLGETGQDDRLRPILDQFADTVESVFEHSAPLMTFPPALARKYNLRLWQRFEESVRLTLQLANAIVDIGLQRLQTSSRMGVIAEMTAMGMSADVIKRIFVDLIIAAGDTVMRDCSKYIY